MARFWKAGSLTSEKGSCTLTLLLDKARRGRGGERGEKVEAVCERPQFAHTENMDMMCTVKEFYLNAMKFWRKSHFKLFK